MALNKEGLRYHRAAFESRLFEGKVATATSPAKEVNDLIPPGWSEKPSVVAMRDQFYDQLARTGHGSRTGHDGVDDQ